MESQFGFKELEQVLIKTTYEIEINGKTFVPGETVAAFDKISIANFRELKGFTTARGGYGNESRVWWETTKEVRLEFTQGIFSRQQFAVMNNAKLLQAGDDDVILIPYQEVVESDEEGLARLSHIPNAPLFIYDYDTGEKLTDYIPVSESSFRIAPFKTVLADYSWIYENGYSKLIIGQQLTNGTFVLTGKTKVKDDITGQTHSGIIKIPKLKLMSELSISLGRDANPVVGRLSAIACPTGPYGQQEAFEINFLNDEIDSDM